MPFCVRAEPETAPDEIPILIEGRVPFVKGSINGRGPFTFILDTGATETVITPPTAQMLGVRALSVSARQKKGTVKTLQVGKYELQNLQVYVFDPPQALPLRLDKGMNYHGILGYSFLSRFVTTLDYRNQTVRFERAAEYRPAAGEDQVEVPLTLRGNLLHAPGHVNGQGPITFLLDTGAAETLLLPETAVWLKLQSARLKNHEGVGLARVESISLGGAAVSGVPVIVHRLTGDTRGPVTYNGILGHQYLSHFKVTISYLHKKLILVSYAEKAPAPETGEDGGGAPKK